jgi:predicted DNA repair protein MutK
MEHLVHGVPVVGGVLGWVVNTLISAIVGVIVGVILVLVIERLPLRRSKGEHGAAAPDGAAH